jgi:hypothetical protein
MKFIWFGMFIGHVQATHSDGAVTAWFPSTAGGPGYLLRIEAGEWRAP